MNERDLQFVIQGSFLVHIVTDSRSHTCLSLLPHLLSFQKVFSLESWKAGSFSNGYLTRDLFFGGDLNQLSAPCWSVDDERSNNQQQSPNITRTLHNNNNTIVHCLSSVCQEERTSLLNSFSQHCILRKKALVGISGDWPVCCSIHERSLHVSRTKLSWTLRVYLALAADLVV